MSDRLPHKEEEMDNTQMVVVEALVRAIGHADDFRSIRNEDVKKLVHATLCVLRGTVVQDAVSEVEYNASAEEESIPESREEMRVRHQDEVLSHCLKTMDDQNSVSQG